MNVIRLMNLVASLISAYFSGKLLVNTLRNIDGKKVDKTVAMTLLLNFIMLFAYSVMSIIVYVVAYVNDDGLSHDLSTYRSLASSILVSLISYSFYRIERLGVIKTPPAKD